MTVERSRDARFPIALWLVVAAVAVLYAPVLRDLVSDWTHDSNYSHGFLIVPAAIWMVWRDRAGLQSSAGAPSGLGLPIVLLGPGGALCRDARGRVVLDPQLVAHRPGRNRLFLFGRR